MVEEHGVLWDDPINAHVVSESAAIGHAVEQDLA